MKRYAMIAQDSLRVVEIVNSESIPHFPPMPDGTEIEAVECSEEIERGYYYVNGEFTEEDPNPSEPQIEIEPERELEPTQLDNIEAQVTYIAMMI